MPRLLPGSARLALQYSLNDRLTLRAGYRILEGGADVDEAYNFALIHFFGAALRYTFCVGLVGIIFRGRRDAL